MKYNKYLHNYPPGVEPGDRNAPWNERDLPLHERECDGSGCTATPDCHHAGQYRCVECLVEEYAAELGEIEQAILADDLCGEARYDIRTTAEDELDRVVLTYRHPLLARELELCVDANTLDILRKVNIKGKENEG